MPNTRDKQSDDSKPITNKDADTVVMEDGGKEDNQTGLQGISNTTQEEGVVTGEVIIGGKPFVVVNDALLEKDSFEATKDDHIERDAAAEDEPMNQPAVWTKEDVVGPEMVIVNDRLIEKESVSEAKVAEKERVELAAKEIEATTKPKKNPKSYLVSNFSITHDALDGVQYRWNEGDKLVDDGTKIPHDAVKSLIDRGEIVLIKED